MIKRSVATAIFHAERPDLILLVQRPPDDVDLPNLWGLPAASLAAGESWSDAARRAARDKLGVDVEVGPTLQQGTTRRTEYDLEMRLLQAYIRSGSPHVPQPIADVTQYQAWRWGPLSELRPAAERGSLCARLCLEWQHLSTGDADAPAG